MASENKPITAVRLDSEEPYFRKQEEAKIRALRDAAAVASSEAYATAHKAHCFRCGTASLVEVGQGGVKVDVCVNNGCGAVHLDPGELETLLADNTVVNRIRKAVFACFE